ncbi:phenylalanyl-tRNA synthetase alpha chain [Fistulifera solaris]|uniref:phenylalanine--tRNA ligase n=1 Tax=Fistulifera solaris TaxID=1519565 RepID=A0A1Z5KBW2_FISSO|nr:phenylalanyl-tRNA synthetase alpha chain [Fistulifera solaris]|eukprot:GAX23645.1 phenylalanyl-tRNA synthetase alpha chain [Fistulifera solaris]
MADACENAVLTHLSQSPDAVISDTFPWSEENGFDHGAVVGCIKSLEVDGYVAAESLSTSFYTLSDEAEGILANGISQEIAVFNAIVAAGSISEADLIAAVGKDVAKIGMGKCMQNKWIQKEKETKSLVPAVAAGDVKDEIVEQLQALREGKFAEDAISSEVSKALKKRKLINLTIRKSMKVARGPSYAPVRKRKAADLTKEMLETGAWQTTEFKPYNFQAFGEKVGGGYLHPLLKVRAEFRKILLEMGFAEMPTNKWVESSFWNFDSLFQPQSHPARDAHDTFFIKEPASTVSVPEEYYERVKTMHEVGGSGSIGYRYDFKREEAFKNLLRTHTTAVSSQMLYKLANQEGGFKPARYFSIDRVFRNETMDATHLCEFHQVEGLVADYDLSLGDLIGTIETFFKKIGITKLRFKPAFNPYTEPSMEIFGYHPDLKKWTEIGNSGMFRPEMLAPMELPENVRVIAWGLSLERPTMIKYRIKNIRELFGHKVDMGRTRTAPVCRFDSQA